MGLQRAAAASLADAVLLRLFLGRVNRHSNSLGLASAQVIKLNTLVQGSTRLIKDLVLSSLPRAAGDQQFAAAGQAAEDKVSRSSSPR